MKMKMLIKITNPCWKNSDGQSITKALVGDEVLLCADVQDIENGASAEITIVEKDKDGNDDEVATVSGKVYNGKIEAKWKVKYTADDDDENSQKELEEKGYTLPEYAFNVECDGVESDESGQLDVKDCIEITINDYEKLKGKSLKLIWKDKSSKTVTIDSKKLVVKDINIGTAKIKII